MDAADYDSQFAAEAASLDHVAVPGPVTDGAVAELHSQPDGTVTAEVRIPGPPVP